MLSNLQYKEELNILDRDNETLPFKFERLNNKGLDLEYMLK